MALVAGAAAMVFAGRPLGAAVTGAAALAAESGAPVDASPPRIWARLPQEAEATTTATR
jgi:hypothetical protein